MKITTYKVIDHDEQLTIYESLSVRVQIKKGLIITVKVDTEDGEVMWWSGMTKSDQKIIDKLTPIQRADIRELLENNNLEL